MLHYRDCCPVLAVAIGAALIAGPLSVSADVKLYGKVHVAMTSLDAKGTDAGGDAASRRNTTVSSNGSRWGLDVTEKLSGSLAAIARLEQQIAVDGETADQASRNRYVGLKGNFGTIFAGVHDTPFKDLSGKVELFPGLRRLQSRYPGGHGEQRAKVGPAPGKQRSLPDPELQRFAGDLPVQC